MENLEQLNILRNYIEKGVRTGEETILLTNCYNSIRNYITALDGRIKEYEQSTSKKEEVKGKTS